MKPFSKLKKVLGDLFEPKLKMEFCCFSYPIKAQYSNNAVPRFCLKLGKEVIWDFPKDFKIKEEQFYMWADCNHISELVRDYIDTPLAELLNKEFENDKVDFASNNYLENKDISVEYKLTALFKAGDRRLGKEALYKWAKNQNNPMVDRILLERFK